MLLPRFVQSLAIVAGLFGAVVPRAGSQTVGPFPQVLRRTEPVLATPADQSSEDAIVAIAATIDASGVLAGPLDIVSFGGQQTRVSMKVADALAMQALLDRIAASSETDRIPRAEYDRIAAALDALQQWRFQPGATAMRAVVGFNFARTPESGVETEAVPVGPGVAPPVRRRDMTPVYPGDALAKYAQASVAVQLVVDAAGVPVSAFAAGPPPDLSMAAVQAALQWRFARDPTNTRRRLTIAQELRMSPGPAGVRSGTAEGIVPGTERAAPTGPVRVGGNVATPIRIKDVPPVMPVVAEQARVQGVVILEIIVGTDGKVQDAKILRSIPLLDQAALDCVRQWEYTPTLLNGAPVPVIMTVTVNFTLK